MSTPKRNAKSVARHRSPTDVWIDHANIVQEDEAWLSGVESLTLWDVKFPAGFLSRLKQLRGLDIRGGSAESLDHLGDCRHLEMLVVNQVRGLCCLDAVAEFVHLRFLSLYGLPKLVLAPSLSKLDQLHRLELGSLKGLQSMVPFLNAPQLRELYILRKMGAGSVDARAIAAHPTLQAFDWNGEDVPLKTWKPVVEAVGLSKAQAMHPHEWFARQQTSSGIDVT
jgi:hypothetical protein